MKTTAAFLSGALAATLAPAAPADAGHLCADRESSFELSLPPAAAFPLFEPMGEKAWAEGWQPVFVSAADAVLHDGSVFTVPLAHHAQSGGEAVWTVSRYDPPSQIEYRNVLPGLRATRIIVTCTPGAAGTRVTVRYTYHGLSQAGDEHIGEITPEKFAGMIREWEAAIASYLRRGTPASP